MDFLNRPAILKNLILIDSQLIMKFFHIVDSWLGYICIDNLIEVVFIIEKRVNIGRFC